MLKKCLISRNGWYLAANVNDISKIRDTKSAQAIVCFSNTLFGTAQVLFYYQEECVKATRSSLAFSDWNHLMRIRATTLGREANEIESSLFNKVRKDLLKTTNNNLETLSEAIRDDAVVDCLIAHDEPDDDSVDGCVIS
ncbi:hypothetical protein N9Q05_00620 [bacterium]|nr:hypothetical protein [bacterium]